MRSRVFRFRLAPPPGHPFTGPGGPAERARGEALLRVWPDGTGTLLTRAEGLRLANNEGGYYQTWLVADLVVPRRVDPADAARLPKGEAGVNGPGEIFTLDGRAPRFLAPLPEHPPNTVWVAVRAGAWGTDETGRQPGARWFLNDFSNWTFWIPEAWGGPPPPFLEEPGRPRDPDAAHARAVRGLPSGLAMELLTDLYIRQATVLPEVASDPRARLEALWRTRVSPLDADGDGLLGYPDVVGRPGLFLNPLSFQRVVVTRELPSAATRPRGYPSTAAVVLAGWREDVEEGAVVRAPGFERAAVPAGPEHEEDGDPGGSGAVPDGDEGEPSPRTEAPVSG
ncbi:MAG TPA: hypothetical protein VIL08_01715 [Limnochorda sp.]